MKKTAFNLKGAVAVDNKPHQFVFIFFCFATLCVSHMNYFLCSLEFQVNPDQSESIRKKLSPYQGLSR